MIAASLAWTACASTREPEPAPPDYPGVLRSADALGADVLWQQTVTARWHGDEQSFDAALQARNGRLDVLGLSPMGQVGFALAWDGRELATNLAAGLELPIPPRFVMLDVQRAFFPWGPVDLTRADGETMCEVEGERVRELVRDGRVVRRTFERLDGRPAGVIAVELEWGNAQWLAPTRAVLDNGWLGYRLEITTHAETRLARDSESPR